MASPCFASETLEVRWNNSTFSVSTILTIFATERTRALSSSTADSACVSREPQQEVAIIRSFHRARPSHPLFSRVPRNDWRTEAQHRTRMQQQYLYSGLVKRKRLQCLLPHPKCVRIFKIHQQSSSPSECRSLRQQTDCLPFHAVNTPIVRLIRLYG